MKNRTIKIFSDIEKLANHSVGFLKKRINEDFSNSGFSIALSGGSTPKKIYKYIADNLYDELDWRKIKLFFGDERCVPSNDEQSNYKMVSDTLLNSINIPRENIFKIDGENRPEDEAKRYSAVLAKELPLNNGIPQFDIVLLGIGEDGHIASIFPDQIEKFNSKNICEFAVHPSTGQNRITITGEVINNAKLVVFIVTGENKSHIVSELLSGNPFTKYYPASLVGPNEGELIWMLDTHSAQLLDSEIKQAATIL